MLYFKLILFQMFVGIAVSNPTNSTHFGNSKNVTHDISTTDGPTNMTKSGVAKVTLRVYYETLCPASVTFIINQLRPAMDKLSPYLDVHLVPYGHAKTLRVRGRYVFRCQHGREECFSNRLHACVIEELRNDTKAAVAFNACLMQFSTRRWGYTPNYDAIFNWCTYKHHQHMYGVAKCVNGDRGAELLKNYGIETHAMHPRYVPYLVINNSTDVRIQDQASDNLIATVCRLLQPTPRECYT